MFKKVIPIFFFISTAQAQNNKFPLSGYAGTGLGSINPETNFHIKTIGTYEAGILLDGPAGGYAHMRLRSNGKEWSVSKRPDFESDRFSIYYNANVPTPAWAEYLSIKTNGNVGLGNGDPQSKLDVNGDVFCKNLKVFDGNVVIGTRISLAKVDVIGDINCRKLKVLPTTWPDYVFKPEYELMPISDLKEFISKNKHLPGVPDEKQVAKEGVELGELNKILLQKIEELTLYIIELKAENEKLNSFELRLRKLEEAEKNISK